MNDEKMITFQNDRPQKPSAFAPGSVSLKGEEGSMIVLVMIVVTLVSMVGAAAMQMFMINRNYAESVSDSTEISLLQTQIGRILQNDDSCRRALGGPVVYGAPATAVSQAINTT